jgi:hypothetical protein
VSNWSSVVNAMRRRFREFVADPRRLVVVHGNQPVDEKTLVGRWVRLSTQAAARTQVSTGAPGHRRFRCNGMMFAVLMEPLNRGDGEQNDLVDAIQASFTGVTIHLENDVAIRFRPPLPAGEALRDGTWWVRTVEIPFQYDEFGGEAP